eukprot:COSAG01_NODE_58816_length_303_cov_3.044118_1_plen_73_part_01
MSSKSLSLTALLLLLVNPAAYSKSQQSTIRACQCAAAGCLYCYMYCLARGRSSQPVPATVVPWWRAAAALIVG